MNILLLCHEHPPLGGGAGNAAAQTARHLAAMGEKVLFVSTGYGGLKNEEDIYGYRLVRLDINRKRMFGCGVTELFKYYLTAGKYLRTVSGGFKPEKTLAYFTLPEGLIAYEMKRSSGVPYAISLRGGDVPGFLKEELLAYQMVLKPLIMKVWKSADALIANSRYMGELAQKSTDKKVNVIPNGNYTEDFHADPAMKSAETINLLFIGRLVTQKRPDVVLKAFSEIKKPGISLTIIGSGPMERKLKSMAERMGEAERVSFVNWAGREELKGHYARSHAILVPSVDEGMPNVVNEALAAGLAVVGTDVGGIPELVRDGYNGYLIKDGTVEALGGALKKLLSDREMLKKFCENSVKMSGKWQWKDAADSVRKVLRGER
ncbi:MAG: glycosyltransferase [Endomicrobiales bacterium]|nr:glycosyltransferase [Endomicrobiales bacterium]